MQLENQAHKQQAPFYKLVKLNGKHCWQSYHWCIFSINEISFSVTWEATKEVGLVINEAAYTQNGNNPCCYEIGRYNFEEFIVLPILVHWWWDNVLEEITNCLIAANRSYFGLKSQLKSQQLSRKTKIHIYIHTCEPNTSIWCRNQTYNKKQWKTEYFWKEKSFAEYMIQYARESSGRRDTIEN
jgi:hypothetical protein